MRTRILSVLHYLIATAIVASGLLALIFWPASHWLSVKTIHISDASQGAPVVMIVDREIVRPFVGRYNVSIHAWVNNAWQAHCNTPISDPWTYKVGAKYPVPLTLQWWTEGKCHPLPPGKYMVTTSWYLYDLGIFPDKRVTVESNIFEVKQ